MTKKKGILKTNDKDWSREKGQLDKREYRSPLALL
jgi:hypothetical protein